MAYPRIGLYVPALRVGGAQHVTVNIANGLASRGYPVDLVVSYHQGGFCDRVDSSVNVVDLETPTLPAIGIGASIPPLTHYLNRAEPSMLFSAMTFANVVALVAHRLANTSTRIIPTEHDEFGMDRRLKSRLVSGLASRLYGSASHILGVSSGVVESVIRQTTAPEDRVSVMYNPIEVDRIREQSRETPNHQWALDPDIELVFTVGRLEPQKDLATLIESFETVSACLPRARLVVAGRGSLADTLTEQVAACGLDDVVDFPGYVDNPYAFMANASVFALSSRHEGLPTVLIEALSCGCPIVSTNCPSGPAEILNDGEFGRLVPVGDPASLADALVDTIEDPPTADRLRRRADDFATETIIDEYVSFIEDHHDTPPRSEVLTNPI